MDEEATDEKTLGMPRFKAGATRGHNIYEQVGEVWASNHAHYNREPPVRSGPRARRFALADHNRIRCTASGSVRQSLKSESWIAEPCHEKIHTSPSSGASDGIHNMLTYYIEALHQHKISTHMSICQSRSSSMSLLISRTLGPSSRASGRRSFLIPSIVNHGVVESITKGLAS